MKGRRDLTNLIQKQRAPVRHFKTPLAQSHGAGEGSALMPEEFRFQHGLRERGAVQPDI